MRRREREELMIKAAQASQAWQALGDILVAAGVMTPGPYTGPELLNAAEAYIDYLDRLKQ